MDSRNLGIFVAFLLAGFCEGRKFPDKSSYDHGVHWRAHDIVENKADQVSLLCRKQLKQITKAIEYFTLNLPDPTNYITNSDATSIRKTLIRKAIIGQPSKLKQSLHRPNGRILKPRGRRRKRPPRRRRRRRRRPPWPPDSPYPSPALSPAYTYAPTPLTPDGAPLTPGEAPLSPDEAPLTPDGAPPTPDGAPLTPGGAPLSPGGASPPTPTRKPFPKPKPRPSPEPFREPSSNFSPENARRPQDLSPRDDSKERKLLIIAATSTTVAAFAIFSLFLVCFLRLKRRRRAANGDGRGEGRRSLATGLSLKSKKIKSSKDIAHNLSTNGASLPEDQESEVESLQLPPVIITSPPPQLTAPPPTPPPPPPPPPPSPPAPEAAQPPPPPKAPNVPNPPKKRPPPPAPIHRRDENNQSEDLDANKTKLKPFFWDKVNANPNRAMVWHDIKAGSFQFNEEMMESLFGASSVQNKNENGKGPPNLQSHPKLVQIIEPKKAQNLAILLKALNVTTEEVSDAVREGNELPVEFISTLLKMAPTQDEELKLRTYNGDVALLGPSEKFLKALVDIPFAFKRLEALMFMASLPEESASVKDSFATLEIACTVLTNSRLFLKLLEAVLKTGNRMNVGTYRGGAEAFKLDNLLKLSDVKGTDGKTTLLSFVVQEMIRSEGTKAARRARASKSTSEDTSQHPSKEPPETYRKFGLEVVSKLSEELENVKKAALIDGDTLTSTVLKLGHMLRRTKDFLYNEMKNVEEDKEFRVFLTGFVEQAEAEIEWLLEEEKRIMAVVKSTGDYFHGTSRKDEGLRLFVIVRDFLLLLDSICNGIKKANEIQAKKKRSDSTTASMEGSFGPKDIRDKLFPYNKDGQSGYSSSDEESDSPSF